MVDFSKLKKRAEEGSNLDRLSKAAEALNTSFDGASNKELFWKPEVDKAGNGMAEIRFLPTPPQDGEDGLQWIKYWHHGFQGPGGWLIDNCLTTHGKNCPVCESNSLLWNSGIEANKQVARDRKRKLNYVSNIYVVSDPKHPENEGKVFLFKYGKKIYEKLVEAWNPTFPDEKPFDPFDLWKGANFKLKIRKVDGYQSYDKSEFATPAPLSEDDVKLEKIYNSEHSLQVLVGEKEFKSYDDLKKRLDKVLGLSSDVPKTTVQTIKETTPKEKFKEPELVAEDDDLDYFARLAEEE
jgi:hypothetical protein